MPYLKTLILFFLVFALYWQPSARAVIKCESLFQNAVNYSTLKRSLQLALQMPSDSVFTQSDFQRWMQWSEKMSTKMNQAMNPYQTNTEMLFEILTPLGRAVWSQAALQEWMGLVDVMQALDTRFYKSLLVHLGTNRRVQVELVPSIKPHLRLRAPIEFQPSATGIFVEPLQRLRNNIRAILIYTQALTKGFERSINASGFSGAIHRAEELRREHLMHNPGLGMQYSLSEMEPNFKSEGHHSLVSEAFRDHQSVFLLRAIARYPLIRRLLLTTEPEVPVPPLSFRLNSDSLWTFAYFPELLGFYTYADFFTHNFKTNIMDELNGPRLITESRYSDAVQVFVQLSLEKSLAATAGDDEELLSQILIHYQLKDQSALSKTKKNGGDQSLGLSLYRRWHFFCDYIDCPSNIKNKLNVDRVRDRVVVSLPSGSPAYLIAFYFYLL